MSASVGPTNQSTLLPLGLYIIVVRCILLLSLSNAWHKQHFWQTHFKFMEIN